MVLYMTKLEAFFVGIIMSWKGPFKRNIHYFSEFFLPYFAIFPQFSILFPSERKRKGRAPVPRGERNFTCRPHMRTDKLCCLKLDNGVQMPPPSRHIRKENDHNTDGIRKYATLNTGSSNTRNKSSNYLMSFIPVCFVFICTPHTYTCIFLYVWYDMNYCKYCIHIYSGRLWRTYFSRNHAKIQ